MKTLSYVLDGQLQNIGYTNEEHETANVTFTYDSTWERLISMVDGTGTTTYSYYSIGATPPLGAGQLASIDGPLANDTVGYIYDELGRVSTRTVDGRARTYQYDALDRMTSTASGVGTFTYEYDGTTSRLAKVSLDPTKN